MSRLVRNLLVLAASLLALAGIGFALWRADWRYGLPTPRPATLVQLDHVDPALLARLRAAAGATSPSEPLLVHVSSPACPCSRFNRDHVLELAEQCGQRIAQLELRELPEGEPVPAVQRDEDLEMQALSESDGGIARALGIYSTPQAVLIDAADRIYYRGNYNQGRFCTRPDSAYASLAVAALLGGRACPDFPPEARRSYGCELPNDAWGRRAP